MYVDVIPSTTKKLYHYHYNHIQEADDLVIWRRYVSHSLDRRSEGVRRVTTNRKIDLYPNAHTSHVWLLVYSDQNLHLRNKIWRKTSNETGLVVMAMYVCDIAIIRSYTLVHNVLYIVVTICCLYNFQYLYRCRARPAVLSTWNALMIPTRMIWAALETPTTMVWWKVAAGVTPHTEGAIWTQDHRTPY